MPPPTKTDLLTDYVLMPVVYAALVFFTRRFSPDVSLEQKLLISIGYGIGIAILKPIVKRALKPLFMRLRAKKDIS